MLRANVGLSRKISRDYQSTGYTVNLDGEVAASPDDPKAILEAVQKLWQLAEQSLAQEIDRDQSEDAVGRRDEPPPAQASPRNGSTGKQASRPNGANDKNQPGQDASATNKQVQYLLSLGKRQGLSTTQLEKRIEEILGSRVGVYQLSKREAGTVIDALTQETAGNGRR